MKIRTGKVTGDGPLSTSLRQLMPAMLDGPGDFAHPIRTRRNLVFKLDGRLDIPFVIWQQAQHLPDRRKAACSLARGFDFKLPSGAVETYVELLEEIHLPQKKWHVLGARPREGKRHRCEIANPGMHEKRSGLLSGQISCELPSSFRPPTQRPIAGRFHTEER